MAALSGRKRKDDRLGETKNTQRGQAKIFMPTFQVSVFQRGGGVKRKFMEIELG